MLQSRVEVDARIAFSQDTTHESEAMSRNKKVAKTKPLLIGLLSAAATSAYAQSDPWTHIDAGAPRIPIALEFAVFAIAIGAPCTWLFPKAGQSRSSASFW